MAIARAAQDSKDTFEQLAAEELEALYQKAENEEWEQHEYDREVAKIKAKYSRRNQEAVESILSAAIEKAKKIQKEAVTEEKKAEENSTHSDPAVAEIFKAQDKYTASMDVFCKEQMTFQDRENDFVDVYVKLRNILSSKFTLSSIQEAHKTAFGLAAQLKQARINLVKQSDVVNNNAIAITKEVDLNISRMRTYIAQCKVQMNKDSMSENLLSNEGLKKVLVESNQKCQERVKFINERFAAIGKQTMDTFNTIEAKLRSAIAQKASTNPGSSGPAVSAASQKNPSVAGAGDAKRVAPPMTKADEQKNKMALDPQVAKARALENAEAEAKVKRAYAEQIAKEQAAKEIAERNAKAIAEQNAKVKAAAGYTAKEGVAAPQSKPPVAGVVFPPVPGATPRPDQTSKVGSNTATTFGGAGKPLGSHNATGAGAAPAPASASRKP